MAKKKKTVASAGGAGSDANVDQIREIIFGAQIRDYEARFQALKDQFEDAFKKLKQELKAEARALDAAIEAERSDRRNEDESLDALIQTRFAELGKELAAAEARADDRIDKLARDTAAARRELERSIEGGNQNLDARLTAVADDLSSRKLARDELAALLNELAQRLSDAPGE